MSTRYSADGTILHIHIPMQLKERGCHKVMVTGDGVLPKPGDERSVLEDPLVNALVRTSRWQKMLESGDVATIGSGGERGVDRSYLVRLLKLNVLSPAIVERILTGNYPDSITLETLRVRIPLLWGGAGAGVWNGVG